MTIGPLLGYIFMTILSISFLPWGSNIPIARLELYELVLLFIVGYSILMIAFKAKRINLILLDLIAVTFVFFTLIPVVLSVDNLYVAARDYRHLYLVPLIAYLSLPIVFEDFHQIPYAFLFIIPGLLIGLFPLVPEFLKTGARPRDYNVTTLGLLSSWSVVLSFSVKNTWFTKFKPLVYITMFLMLLIMALCVSRAIIFAFLISLVLVTFIIKKKVYQKIFIFSIIGLLMVFYFSLLVVDESSLKPKTELSDDYRKMRRSVHRLISFEYYIDDIKDRVSLWREAFYIGLDNPILGRGASGYRKFMNLGRSTPHNIFISIFLTSGMVGVFLFVILIIVSYTTIFSFAKIECLKLFSRFLFIALTITLISGATNDFSGGRYLLFFIILSGIAATKKYAINIE